MNGLAVWVNVLKYDFICIYASLRSDSAFHKKKKNSISMQNERNKILYTVYAATAAVVVFGAMEHFSLKME